MTSFKNFICISIIVILPITSFVSAQETNTVKYNQPTNIGKQLISFAKGSGASAFGALIAYVIAPAEYKKASLAAGSYLGICADHYISGQYDANIGRRFGYIVISGGITGGLIGEKVAMALAEKAINSDQGFIQSNTKAIAKSMVPVANGMRAANDADISPEQCAIRYKFVHAISNHTGKNSLSLKDVTPNTIASHATNIFLVVTFGDNRQVACDDIQMHEEILKAWSQRESLGNATSQTD